eukprot:gene15477-17057_t
MDAFVLKRGNRLENIEQEINNLQWTRDREIASREAETASHFFHFVEERDMKSKFVDKEEFEKEIREWKEDTKCRNEVLNEVLDQQNRLGRKVEDIRGDVVNNKELQWDYKLFEDVMEKHTRIEYIMNKQEERINNFTSAIASRCKVGAPINSRFKNRQPTSSAMTLSKWFPFEATIAMPFLFIQSLIADNAHSQLPERTVFL